MLYDRLTGMEGLATCAVYVASPEKVQYGLVFLWRWVPVLL